MVLLKTGPLGEGPTNVHSLKHFLFSQRRVTGSVTQPVFMTVKMPSYLTWGLRLDLSPSRPFKHSRTLPMWGWAAMQFQVDHSTTNTHTNNANSPSLWFRRWRTRKLPSARNSKFYNVDLSHREIVFKQIYSLNYDYVHFDASLFIPSLPMSHFPPPALFVAQTWGICQGQCDVLCCYRYLPCKWHNMSGNVSLKALFSFL